VIKFKANKKEVFMKHDKDVCQVIVIFEIRKGQEANFKKELFNIMPLLSQEEGYLNHQINEDIDNPARVIVYETWTHAQAHLRLETKPYVIDFINRINNVLCHSFIRIYAKNID
jgi:quinol monooxygenase YgiN